MVTAGGAHRLPRIAHAIADYTRQSYPRRELVIVADQMADDDFTAIRDHCRALRRSDIRIVRPTAKHSLGELRNLAVDSAAGDIICQWDDDDLYHPRRLELQHAALHEHGEGAVYLEGLMHFLEPYRVVFWLDAPHPATLMAFKRDLPRYPDVGEDAERAEAAAVMADLTAAAQTTLLRNLPYLYTYVFHGNNTISLAVHLTNLRYAAADALLARHKPRLLSELAVVGLTGKGIRLMSCSGVVAELD